MTETLISKATDVDSVDDSEVAQLKRLAQDVSAGSEEKTLGLEQISRAISQIEETTQLNAARAEQLTAQSGALVDVVGRATTAWKRTDLASRSGRKLVVQWRRQQLPIRQRENECK